MLYWVPPYQRSRAQGFFLIKESFTLTLLPVRGVRLRVSVKHLGIIVIVIDGI